MPVIALLPYGNHHIGVGTGQGHLPLPPPKKSGKIFFGQKSCKIRDFVNFSGKCHVKVGHFVNLSCIYFRAKMSSPPQS